MFSMDQYKAITLLRKVLMEADVEIIQTIIDMNIIHTILKLIENGEHTHLVYESSWCIANLASGNKH